MRSLVYLVGRPPRKSSTHLNIPHIPPTLATSGQRFTTGLQRGEVDFKQLVHSLDRPHEVLELPPEDLGGVSEDRVEVRASYSDEIQLLF